MRFLAAALACALLAPAERLSAAGRPGDPAELRLPDLDGRIHDLSDYRGRWVIVNFWATWCPPCREEIPELVLFHERHAPERAVVLGVNFEDIPPWELERFVQEQLIEYPILRSAPEPRTRMGYILALPVTYVVDPQGRIHKVHAGPVTAEQLEAYTGLETRTARAEAEGA
jgi:thiol-disulfide isomerase/thioredoxin